MSGTCNGSCCVVFPLITGPDYDWTNTLNGPFIRDMIQPLTFDEAQARWAIHGQGEWPSRFWDGHTDGLNSCRHWDTETRLCTVYDDRPLMCREYPYGGPCNAGCDFDAELPFNVMVRYGTRTEEQAEAPAAEAAAS